MGYMSLLEGMTEGEVLPVVIILPHKMDLIGMKNCVPHKLPVTLGMSDLSRIFYLYDLKDMAANKIEEWYHSNTTTYLSRIRAAVVHHVKTT